MIRPYLRIRNLGSVKDAWIKVGKLTIFVGKNNTNKTWTAYVVHAIASEKNIRDYVSDFIWERSLNLKIKRSFYSSYFPKMEEYINSIIQEKPTPLFTKKDINFIKGLIKDYLNYIAITFYDFISISKREIKDLKVSLYWPRKEGEIENLLELFNKTSRQLIKNRWLEECLENSLDDDDDNKRKCCLTLIIKAIVNSLFGSPFNLPVERNTLITFSNLITLGEGYIPITFFRGRHILRDLKRLEYTLSQTPKVSERVRAALEDAKKTTQKFIDQVVHYQARSNYNYPIPIGEFKRFIQRLPSLKVKEKPLNEFLLKYLQQIIEGKIGVTESGIYYKVNDGVILPIIVSSSMVKSLGGLYAYIAYKAEKNDLLIMDEPENNLHPRAQVKMIEFLSIMANKGIKVLATTHSPYIVDHLTNLMEADNVIRLKKRKPEEIASKFYLKSKDAFISKNEVSVYFFTGEGKVKDILNPKTGIIDWETFSSISEEISELYYEI